MKFMLSHPCTASRISLGNRRLPAVYHNGIVAGPPLHPAYFIDHLQDGAAIGTLSTRAPILETELCHVM